MIQYITFAIIASCVWAQAPVYCSEQAPQEEAAAAAAPQAPQVPRMKVIIEDWYEEKPANIYVDDPIESYPTFVGTPYGQAYDVGHREDASETNRKKLEQDRARRVGASSSSSSASQQYPEIQPTREPLTQSKKVIGVKSYNGAPEDHGSAEGAGSSSATPVSIWRFLCKPLKRETMAVCNATIARCKKFLNIQKSLLEDTVQEPVLLCGAARTGKTSLAKALGFSTGRHVIHISFKNYADHTVEHHMDRLDSLLHSLRRDCDKQYLVILDDLDYIQDFRVRDTIEQFLYKCLHPRRLANIAFIGITENIQRIHTDLVSRFKKLIYSGVSTAEQLAAVRQIARARRAEDGVSGADMTSMDLQETLAFAERMSAWWDAYTEACIPPAMPDDGTEEPEDPLFYPKMLACMQEEQKLAAKKKEKEDFVRSVTEDFLKRGGSGCQVCSARARKA